VSSQIDDHKSTSDDVLSVVDVERGSIPSCTARVLMVQPGPLRSASWQITRRPLILKITYPLAPLRCY